MLLFRTVQANHDTTYRGLTKEQTLSQQTEYWFHTPNTVSTVHNKHRNKCDDVFYKGHISIYSNRTVKLVNDEGKLP